MSTIKDRINGTFLGIARDKWGHLLSFFGGGVFVGYCFSTGWALLIIAAVAVGWEYWQKVIYKTVPDEMDIVFSIVGGIIGLSVIKLI